MMLKKFLEPTEEAGKGHETRLHSDSGMANLLGLLP